jgi:group I intron endonuclease
MADMTNQCGVYSITNTINGRVYVGSSARFRRRKYEHLRLLRRGEHDNDHLQKAWNKYGERAFEFRFELGVHESLLLWVEKIYIDANEDGYNIAKQPTSSMRGRKHKPESRALMSLAHRGQIVSEETRRKIGLAHKGRLITPEAREKTAAKLRGKPHKHPPGVLEGFVARTIARNKMPITEDRRRKLRESHLGQHLTKETIAKIVAKNKGKKRSAEFCQQLSARTKGRKLSAETKAKLHAANLGKKASQQSRAKVSLTSRSKMTGRGYFTRRKGFCVACCGQRFMVKTEDEAKAAVARIRSEIQ